jgi:tetratricopeptide (TPR) repeat protein
MTSQTRIRKAWFGFRIILAAVGVGLVAVAVALGVWLGRPQPPPEPPLPDLTGADQEVVEIIQKARDKVLGARSSATAWGQLGEVLLAHDYNPDANRCFQQAERLDPHEPAWPYLQGLNLVIHNPEAGIPCLERADKYGDGRQVEPRLLLAEVLLERGRLDEAQSLLEQVRSNDPDNIRAQLDLGRLELLRQNWRAGLDQLEKCRNDPHTRKRAATLRAEAWNQLEEMEKARAEQRQAAELPDDQSWPDPIYERILSLRRGLRARFQSVDYLLQAGRVPEALQLLAETVDKYPSSLEGWMRLGEVLHRVQRPEQAQACFQRAVGLAPNLAEAWFRLGCIQSLMQSREAETSFRQAIRCKPHYAQAHYNLGLCLKEKGQRDAAAEAFQQALRCRPDYDLAQKALRELEAQKGKKP